LRQRWKVKRMPGVQTAAPNAAVDDPVGVT
jgi:hypothetical protein